MPRFAKFLTRSSRDRAVFGSSGITDTPQPSFAPQAYAINIQDSSFPPLTAQAPSQSNRSSQSNQTDPRRVEPLPSSYSPSTEMPAYAPTIRSQSNYDSSIFSFSASTQGPPSTYSPSTAPSRTSSIFSRSRFPRRSNRAPGPALPEEPEVEPMPVPALHGQPPPDTPSTGPDVNITAADVRHATRLLRQFHRLELEIFGLRFSDDEESVKYTTDLKHRADLLRLEIEGAVNMWNLTSGADWNQDESGHVQYGAQNIGALAKLRQGV